MFAKPRSLLGSCRPITRNKGMSIYPDSFSIFWCSSLRKKKSRSTYITAKLEPTSVLLELLQQVVVDMLRYCCTIIYWPANAPNLFSSVVQQNCVSLSTYDPAPPCSLWKIMWSCLGQGRHPSIDPTPSAHCPVRHAEDEICQWNYGRGVFSVVGYLPIS